MLRELYTRYVKTQLEQENKTVLILPHYETTDSLKMMLAADNDNDNVMKKSNESLILMDSIKGLFGADDHMTFVSNLVNRAENGVLVIADAGPFFHTSKNDKLVEHELSMPSRFDVNLMRFCVFHKRDFDKLSKEEKKLIIHHGQVLIIDDK
ncbi:MAG TPA: hypothetical protein VJ729_08595 [Nitrososphaeraceae archaeon]|nr:hypothetical protein [Nitrososphaeraceae archaeon]